MNIFVKLIISLGVAIVAAIISLLLPGIDGAFVFIIGILFFIVTTLILEIMPISKSLEEFKKTNDVLLNLLTSLFEKKEYFHDFYNISLLSHIRKSISKVMKEGEIKIPSEEVPLFWLKLIHHFSESLFAATYSDPREGWDAAYTKLALDIQGTKVKEGKTIRRVFIVKTDEELNQILRTIKGQRERGIDAKYILQNKIETHSFMSKIKVETYDFGLIDKEFLGLIMLDENRKIRELKLLRDKTLYEKYAYFYTYLFNEASLP